MAAGIARLYLNSILFLHIIKRFFMRAAISVAYMAITGKIDEETGVIYRRVANSWGVNLSMRAHSFHCTTN